VENELSPIEARLREHYGEDAEEYAPGYSIEGKHPDDPVAQGELAGLHAARLEAENRIVATECAAIDVAIRAAEDHLEMLHRRRADVLQAGEARPEHDRRILSEWMRTAKHIREAKRKELLLGAIRIGTRHTKATEKPDAPNENLVAIFPDLTEPKLTDRRAALARLSVRDGKVIVTDTGEVIEDGHVRRTEAHTTVWVSARDGERVTIDDVTEAQYACEEAKADA
jgi:hypothetical protein